MLDAIKDSTTELRFTGNWFIDAGILGFVNLMEEVYGWDLKKLQEVIINEPEKVYYGYFPFAYLFYHSRVRTIRSEINEIIKDRKKKEKHAQLKNKISQDYDEISEKEKNLMKELDEFKQNIENKISSIIANIKDIEDFKKKKEDINSLIPNFDLKLPKDHRNFFIYNPKKDLYNSFVYLYFLLKEDYSNLYKFVSLITKKKKKENLTYEVRPDSTINPFLYSPGEFSNIGYTGLPSTTMVRDWLNVEQPLYLLLLAFGNSFQYIAGRNLMFYTNLLESSYEINKKFALYNERKKRNTDVFKITWSAIIDTLIEKKANFSLENMYLIEFGEIEHLKLKGVEFMGIPKLQASILLDDTIREHLNRSIQYRKIRENKKTGKKQFEWRWLLEEFIKGKPLYPIILNHINLVLNEEIYLNKYASLYSLIVEAKILEFKSKNKKSNLFSADYFDNYKYLINKIKDEVRFTSFRASYINQISQDDDIKKRIARDLFDALKAENKNIFLNILLKNLNEVSNKYSYSNLNNWIYDKIIKNEVSWKMYGLILIMYLLRGGESNE